MFKKTVLIFLSFGFFLYANELKIAAAAGYKKPLLKVTEAYKRRNGAKNLKIGDIVSISTKAFSPNITYRK